MGTQGYVGSIAVYQAEDLTWGAACRVCPPAEWLVLICWTEECPLPFSHPVHEPSHIDIPYGNEQQGLKAHLGIPNLSPTLQMTTCLVLLLPLELQELVSFPLLPDKPGVCLPRAPWSSHCSPTLVASPVHGFWHLHHPGDLLVWLCLFSVPQV